jgi:hypothetical protein
MYYYGYNSGYGYGNQGCYGGCGYPGYGGGCGYPGYGGGFGSGAAIILVLFILLVIVIGSRFIATQ